MHWVVKTATTDTVKMLIRAGANVNAKDMYGRTPLHKAAADIHTTWMAKLLVEAGPDVNAKDGNGYTPLHVAAYFGNWSAAKVLIKAGADVNAKNNKGETPFDVAKRRGLWVDIRIVLEDSEVCAILSGLSSEKAKAAFLEEPLQPKAK